MGEMLSSTSSCQTAGRILTENPRSLKQFTFVTINGKLVIDDAQDHMKLVRLARAYAEAVRKSLNLVWSDVSHKDAAKLLYNVLPNYVYLETAYKNAKSIAENIRFFERATNKNRILVSIRRLWIACRGNRWDGGNRNIRLMPKDECFEVLIRYPWDRSWIRARAYFGEKYVSLLRELVKLASEKAEGYGVVISFREHPRIHVQVPMWLYLRHFSSPKSTGYGLLAGLDVNSDRLNVVVIDRSGDIVALKTLWFSDVVSHGFPKEKARQVRLNALRDALMWCRRIGVDYIALEDLTEVRARRFTNNPSANRRISRFAKRQLLWHCIVKALRLGLTVVLVNPGGTTSSLTRRQVMTERGLDRHMASAYMIAYRGLKALKSDER